MNKREFEELVYEYGHVMYRSGRMETDDNASGKEYNNMTSKKEELTKIFDEFFKTCIKF
jgi:hypothetical protein